MKLGDFEPPVINETPAKEKSSEQLHAEIYGLNYEKMTASKLRWLIALSGSQNPMYKGKGDKRRGFGDPVDKERFPKKAERDENDKVVGPGSKPSTPFTRECPTGSEACIAREANKIVQNYFAKARVGLAPRVGDLSEPQHTNDATRKKWKMPKKSVGKDGKAQWAAPRPSGTYAQTGQVKDWNYQAQIDRSSDPRMKTVAKDNERLVRQLALANKENEALKKAPRAEDPPEPKKRIRKRKKRKPQPSGETNPTPPSDNDKQEIRLAARKRAKSQARSGPAGAGKGKIDLNSIDRNYVPINDTDENISRALYG